MSREITFVVAASVVVLLCLSAFWAKKNGKWRSFFIDFIGLVLFVSLLNALLDFPFPKSDMVTKGSQNDLLLTTALYICMVLGMLAQFLYHYFVEPSPTKLKFEWGLFLAPLFASPIVFIPLMVTLQNADIDLMNLTIPRMMIFLVAFQNGFFWKEHFDRRRKEVHDNAK